MTSAGCASSMFDCCSIRSERYAMSRIMTTAASTPTFQTARFMCGILIVRKPYCNQMPRAQTITSAANPLLKEIRRAIGRGGLTAQGWCLAEGFHLLEEALRSRCRVGAVVVSESAAAAAESIGRGAPGAKFTMIPDALFGSLSTTENSQGLIALIEPPAWTLEDLFRGTPLIVVLDGIQDPGNAGTIVRTAEAFGASGAVFLKGSVSPFNPKALRGSAGSLFRLPFVHGVEAGPVREILAGRRVEMFAALPARPGAPARTVGEANLTGPCAVAIGSEAHGVGEEFRRASTALSIPTVGVESLNAAIAAGILLYEAHRQRTVPV